MKPKGPRYDQKHRDQVFSAYQNRVSVRCIKRTFRVCYQTVVNGCGEVATLSAWADTLPPGEKGDVLGLDELWRFVQSKSQEAWLWITLCRRTHQVVAYIYTCWDGSTST